MIESNYRKLEKVRATLGDCQRCPLHETRRNIVFGSGDPRASLMFIGEAPGEEEDKQGQPFVGKAGELLTRMIQAMGWSRETVYIANILKCRPPANRYPEKEEIATCKPFVMEQVKTISPLVVVTLGNLATKTLLGIEDGITSIRGIWKEWQGLPVMPTFHPSFLLRQPSGKFLSWRDLRAVMKKLSENGVSSPFPAAMVKR